MSTPNLVIYGSALTPAHIDALRTLSGAAASEEISPHAVRLRQPLRHDGVEDYCAREGIDFAFVPTGQRLADFGLIAFDMDSTMITIECIDEIADMNGLKPEVAAITEAAMRGEIDYVESLKRRVSLLAGLEATALDRVYRERLRLSPGAQDLLAGVKAAGLKTLLVSGGFTFFTGRLREEVGIDRDRSNTLEIAAGKLTGRVVGDIVDAHGKAEAVKAMQRELGIERAHTIAVGDGANDLKMMMEAKISVAYHAKPIVREQASYAINFGGLDGILNFFE